MLHGCSSRFLWSEVSYSHRCQPCPAWQATAVPAGKSTWIQQQVTGRIQRYPILGPPCLLPRSYWKALMGSQAVCTSADEGLQEGGLRVACPHQRRVQVSTGSTELQSEVLQLDAVWPQAGSSLPPATCLLPQASFLQQAGSSLPHAPCLGFSC